MKYYLLLEVRTSESGLSDHHERLPILEEALKAYNAAKENKDNASVYLSVILKEIDL